MMMVFFYYFFPMAIRFDFFLSFSLSSHFTEKSLARMDNFMLELLIDGSSAISAVIIVARTRLVILQSLFFPPKNSKSAMREDKTWKGAFVQDFCASSRNGTLIKRKRAAERERKRRKKV